MHASIPQVVASWGERSGTRWEVVACGVAGPRRSAAAGDLNRVEDTGHNDISDINDNQANPGDSYQHFHTKYGSDIVYDKGNSGTAHYQ